MAMQYETDIFAIAQGKGGAVLLMAKSSDWKIEPYVETTMNKMYEDSKQDAINEFGATENNWREAYNQFFPMYSEYYGRNFNSLDEYFEFQIEKAKETFTNMYGTRK